MNVRLFAIPVVTVLLLGGMVAQRLTAKVTGAPTAASQAYQQAVKRQVLALPEKIGDWTGAKTIIPASAIALLHPNVILGRRYTNSSTGLSFDFIIVQVSDARDMLGHYPPICYPANGWVANGKSTQRWNIDGMSVPGTWYRFNQLLTSRSAAIDVLNIIMLPDNRFGQNMRDIRLLARNHNYRAYGAAQIQFVFANSYSPKQEEQVVKTFLRIAAPIMKQVLHGPSK